VWADPAYATSVGAQSAASAAVTTVFPAATIGYTPAATGSGVSLAIAVPEAAAVLPGAGSPDLAAPTPPPTEGADVIAGELGWKAALVAATAGLSDVDIVSYQLTEFGRTFTPSEENYVTGQLRKQAGAGEYQASPGIGTVPLTAMTAQLASNVSVLESALPPGTVLGTQQDVIPVDPAANAFAFEVNLRVTNLASLQDYEGDLVNGLSTGLVGSPAAPAEGLAINVVDSQGLRASWWSAERAGTGMGVSDPALPSTGGSETVTFPDITGGPAATSFGTGGSVGAAYPSPSRQRGSGAGPACSDTGVMELLLKPFCPLAARTL
jgi:hypothetical protein